MGCGEAAIHVGLPGKMRTEGGYGAQLGSGCEWLKGKGAAGDVSVGPEGGGTCELMRSWGRVKGDTWRGRATGAGMAMGRSSTQRTRQERGLQYEERERRCLTLFLHEGTRRERGEGSPLTLAGGPQGWEELTLRGREGCQALASKVHVTGEDWEAQVRTRGC